MRRVGTASLQQSLGPGHYSLKIRAVGYDLDGPKAVEVAAGKLNTVDIKLRPTEDLASQLTDAEWAISLPGSPQQKRPLLDCNGCHMVDRIVKSTHTAEEFMQIFKRMATYSPGSTPQRPQVLVGESQREPVRSGSVAAYAEWLASVNLSAGPARKYPLQTLPRPKGRATHVIMTQYDLPRKLAEPHDVIVDSTQLIR